MVTPEQDIQNRNCFRMKQPHRMSIKVVDVSTVVWEKPIGSVMGKYGEEKCSPKPQDEENPSDGMMYQNMVDMYMDREGMRVAGREEEDQ